MSKNLNMTQGRPGRLLLSFALPLMFGNIFQQLYTVVDTAIVGRGVSMEALAALGTVDWFNWMWLGVAQGFTQGFSVRIAQRFGEGNEAALRHTAAQSAVLCIAVAVIFTLAGRLGLPLFLQLLRVPEQLVPMARLYARILLAGFPVVTFYNLCSGILRAVGDSKAPLMAMIAASVTNIVLDLLAVFVLDLGIAGAAWATVAAQCLAGILCALRIWKTPQLRFTGKQLRPEGSACADLIRIGTPVAAKNVIIALGGMTVQSVVNGFAMSFIAGFTATNKLYGLLELAAISYGYAVTTYVGQNYGAAKPERIRSGMRAGVILSLLTSIVIALVMLVFGRQITMLFISSADPLQAIAAGETAYRYLCAMSFSLPVLYLLYVYQSALQGLGNTVIPMVSGMVEFVLRVSVSMLVGFLALENGIFLAEVGAWFGAALILCIAYYGDMRRRFPVTQ